MVFEEKQKLKLWWLYIIFGLHAIIILSVTLLTETDSLTKAKHSFYLPVVSIIFLFVLAFILNLNQLTLVIDDDGIRYSAYPFGKTKNIYWNDIEALYLRKYDAFGEYGGLGLRYRLWFKFKDVAYLFNDNNIGLQVVLKKNKRILFSINNVETLRSTLQLKRDQLQLLMIDANVR